ncbi:MAG: Spy/CpxP family protein refolding chaperone [Myxococcales bacterium]
MFGFLIGTASLIGLIAVLRGGRHGWRGHHGYGQRRFLRWIFERLDTTHGQEKVILSAVEDLNQAFYTVRDELRASREELARAMRSSQFDHQAVETAWARQDRLFASLREKFTVHLAKIHEALDPRQREQFADLLQSGPRAFGGGCGWRRAHGCHGREGGRYQMV